MEKNRGAKKRHLSAKGPSDSTNDQTTEKSMKKDEAESVPSSEVIELKQKVVQLEKETNDLQNKVTELTQQLEEEREGRKEDETKIDKLSEKLDECKRKLKQQQQPKKDPRFLRNKTFLLMKVSSRTADYDMEEMKKQIETREGEVVEDTDDIPQFGEAYLISDQHSRDYKYLYALARDMPCLSYKWLQKCVKTGSFLPFNDYKLSAGGSELDHELHPLSSIRGKLLAGKYIMVHCTDYKKKWPPIVELLGGRVVSDETIRDKAGEYDLAHLRLPSDFDILLTDGYLDGDIAMNVEDKGKDIVGEEWLIESIIMGERVDLEEYEDLRLDFN